MDNQQNTAMTLTISIIQTSLFWENTVANLAMFEEKIEAIGQTDLIVLPEMFSTGFTMQPEKVAEPMNFTTFKWMKMMAKKTGAIIIGSCVIKENDNYYNRLIWMQPDGNFDCYDKKHLFRMGGEDSIYKAGTSKIIKELKGFKICPLICYDLRFPVWARNINLEYDVLIYVANWPAVRRNVWNTLLQARAIENQCYVVGTNIVGTDGNGLNYCGDSVIVDFKGTPLETKYNEEAIITQTIDKTALDDFRAKFPAYLDADSFTLG